MKFLNKKNTKKKGKYCVTMLIIMMNIVIIILIVLLFKEKKSYGIELENKYNMAFYQLVDDIQDVEVYLAKSTITGSSKSSTEILTYIWREASQAETYLSMLPISSVEIENTAKFINQVSDYCYSLSRKTINGENLTQEELDKLEELHKYCFNLKDALNQLATDFDSGKVSWTELTNKDINNIPRENISAVEENFHEYAGLIYDGAFSEHMTSIEPKGVTGDNIDENTAKEIAKKVIGKERIKNISYSESTEDTNIESYDYCIECKDGNLWWISITKKGGHILYINTNRAVKEEYISEDEASKKAETFLNENNYRDMKKTYYTKNNGVETINFAYEEKVEDCSAIVYPDLIKIKVALDNGEILGMESTGYLNSHRDRSSIDIKVSKEDAISRINSNLNIEGIRLAIIPTEFQTETICWEIKGTVDNKDFLVYVNVENGNEEDILMILNSSEGVLTM